MYKKKKKKKQILYISASIIALIFTIGFILCEIPYINNILDIFILIGFSLFIFIFAFMGFGCGLKIILKC